MCYPIVERLHSQKNCPQNVGTNWKRGYDRRRVSNRTVPRAPNPTTNPAAFPKTKPPSIAGSALSPRPPALLALSQVPPAETAHPTPHKDVLQAPTTQRSWEIAPPVAAIESGTSRPTVPEPMRSPGDGSRAAPYLSYLCVVE